MEENIILVDKNDNQTGVGEKLAVHRSGKLHRAFSIFIFNSKGELMLQKRAKTKYHGGGLWTNTCCSHPRPGEGLSKATKRRLLEEMGFEAELCESFSFIYKAKVENGLIENEFDHVFIGKYELEPQINLSEVEAWKWFSFEELENDIKKNKEAYTFWFREIINKHKDKFKNI